MSGAVHSYRTHACPTIHDSGTGANASTGLRMVFLLGGLGVGGAERQAIALAAELHRRGEQVHIVVMEDGPLRTDVEAAGVPLRVINRPLGFSPAAMPMLVDCLRDIVPDVVYAFLEVQWLLALLAARSLDDARVVLGLRTSGYRPLRASMRQRAVLELVRRAVSRADLLIANSAMGLADLTAQCHACPPGLVIPNGIDLASFAPLPYAAGVLRTTWGIPRDAVVVGHVGRLNPVKNHELLIDAFSDLGLADPRLWLVCVGDGPPERREALLARAARRGVSDRVLFTGPRTDLAAVYSAIDILALPSLREGFPNVVAEAMACGVPAVVTDTGAAREIVGELGEVVAVSDRHAFAAAMQRLIARRTLALSAACRMRILDAYTLEGCATRTLDAFQSLFPSVSAP